MKILGTSMGDAFGGIIPIMEQFDALLAQTIVSTLGGDVHGMPVRSTKALIYRGDPNSG